MGKRINSPFKFLDSYTLEDQEVFFGRDQEVETLYEYINMNKLVLVYGESGTGKTSLVQCGLASRFDITDWYPLFIRRQGNILQSFEQELRKAAKSSYRDDWVETLRRMNARYLRPTYLIFDQFEELLILGDEAEELEPFIEKLTSILNADDLGCHILLILREEYIAQLYQFEKRIPTLFDRRLRVEPMTQRKITEVIERSCNHYNIQFENPNKNIQQIIDNLSSGRSGIALPYLQVYLDMLYREDYERTFPSETPKDQYPELEFTTAEIDSFGEITDILERFLKEQTNALQKELKEDFPAIQDNFVWQALDDFVTGEGTKRVIPFQRVDDNIRLDTNSTSFLGDLTTPLLNSTLNGLETRRILRSDEQIYELAHDSLARLIDKNRSDEQRQLNEIKNLIRNWHLDHLRFGGFFSEKQLISIEELLPKINLTNAEKAFIKQGRQHIEAEKKAEEERKNQLLLAEQEKLFAQKRNKRNQVLALIVSLTAIITISSGFYIYDQKQKLTALATRTISSEMMGGRIYKKQGNYDFAIQSFQQAEQLIYEHSVEETYQDTLSTISVLREETIEVKGLVDQADSLANLTGANQILIDTMKIAALKLYKDAQQIATDPIIEGKIGGIEREMEDLLLKWYGNAQNRNLGGRIDLALEAIEIAKLFDGQLEVDPKRTARIEDLEEQIRNKLK